MGFFSDISLILQAHSSFDVGLMQARGYRTLKQLSASVLKPEGLSTIEWAIFGILTHHPKGLRPTEIANELGVQPPLVSRILQRAETSGWLCTTHGEDKRVHIITLSEKGKKGVTRIEKQMQLATKPFLKGVAVRDLTGYLRTLAIIAQNGKDMPPGTLEDYIPE